MCLFLLETIETKAWLFQNAAWWKEKDADEGIRKLVDDVESF